MSITFGNDLGGVLIGVFLFVIGYVCCFRKKAYPVYKLFFVIAAIHLYHDGHRYDIDAVSVGRGSIVFCESCQ